MIVWGWGVVKSKGKLKGTKFLFEVTKITKIDCGDGTHICDYNKNHWIIHFNLVNCMMCALYSNKALLKGKYTRKKQNKIYCLAQCTHYNRLILTIGSLKCDKTSWKNEERRMRKRIRKSYHNDNLIEYNKSY